jgi:hypothetical protein
VLFPTKKNAGIRNARWQNTWLGNGNIVFPFFR